MVDLVAAVDLEEVVVDPAVADHPVVVLAVGADRRVEVLAALAGLPAENQVVGVPVGLVDPHPVVVVLVVLQVVVAVATSKGLRCSWTLLLL